MCLHTCNGIYLRCFCLLFRIAVGFVKSYDNTYLNSIFLFITPSCKQLVLLNSETYFLVLSDESAAFYELEMLVVSDGSVVSKI